MYYAHFKIKCTQTLLAYDIVVHINLIHSIAFFKPPHSLKMIIVCNRVDRQLQLF